MTGGGEGEVVVTVTGGGRGLTGGFGWCHVGTWGLSCVSFPGNTSKDNKHQEMLPSLNVKENAVFCNLSAIGEESRQGVRIY